MPVLGPSSAPAGLSPVDEALTALGRKRSSSEFFTYALVTGSELVVSVELAAGSATPEGLRSGADVRVSVDAIGGGSAGAATGRIDPVAGRGVLLRVPLGASNAEGWRVNVTIAGRTETFSDHVDVKLSSSTLLGDPLVFRTTPASRAPLQPMADFQLRRTERLHLEWPILTSLETRTIRLLDRTAWPHYIAPLPNTAYQR